MRVLVTFYQWGQFVMLTMGNLDLISVQSWTHLDFPAIIKTINNYKLHKIGSSSKEVGWTAGIMRTEMILPTGMTNFSNRNFSIFQLRVGSNQGINVVLIGFTTV